MKSYSLFVIMFSSEVKIGDKGYLKVLKSKMKGRGGPGIEDLQRGEKCKLRRCRRGV